MLQYTEHSADETQYCSALNALSVLLFNSRNQPVFYCICMQGKLAFNMSASIAVPSLACCLHVES